MVENAEESTLLSEMCTTSSFISQSEEIQKSLQKHLAFKQTIPTHSELQEEDMANDELPHFGSTDDKFEDPLDEEHKEITELLAKIQA